MSEHPIIFSASMVRAILDGRKSMTRRVVKPQPIGADYWTWHSECLGHGAFFPNTYKAEPALLKCPYGVPGSVLWVREAFWTPTAAGRDYTNVVYALEHAEGGREVGKRKDGSMVEGSFIGQFTKRPSIHMPRWASRLTLRVESVRVERLQEISNDDILAEGVGHPIGHKLVYGSVTELWNRDREFRPLWDSINGKKHPWESNPWVWVIGFSVAD